jgi:hypothetical protein
VVPEDGEPGAAVTGACVVNMQRTPVTQRKISLCHRHPAEPNDRCPILPIDREGETGNQEASVPACDPV